MFDSFQIYKVNNFLTEEERTKVYSLCDSYPWKLSGESNPANNKTSTDRIIWNKDLWENNPCHELETILKNKIESIFNIKILTERIYLNGQAHGQCGSLHKDVTGAEDVENYMTSVYYYNKQWQPIYGGFTVIYDKENNLHVSYPEPNSLIIFNSSFDHAGLEPTIHCNHQRVTMAHKFKIIKE